MNISSQPTERLVGFAQLAISVLFLIGYFGVLAVFLLGLVKTDPTWRDALIALLGVVTGAVGTVMGFWFSRSRPQGSQ